jgi:hypothetical protein
MDVDPGATLHRMWQEVVSFARDWHHAQRLLVEWQLAPERAVFSSGKVPATYADFLFLTAGPRPHELSARARARRAASRHR